MLLRQIDQSLTSNAFILSDASDRLGWLVPTNPNQSPSVLRAQYQAQGYLWLKGILDPEKVLDFRRRFFEAFVGSGLLAEGTSPVEGIYSGGGKGHVSKILGEIVQLAAYEA